MKKLYHIFSIVLFLSLAITACNKDEGNYTYLPEEEVGIIKFDTTGMTTEERLALNYDMNPGDIISFNLKVKYKYPEQLRYRWFVIPNPYSAVQEGNALVYPKADTIARTLALTNWECNLKPGMWRFYCMAEDSVSGMRGYYQAQEQYVRVNQAGTASGLYLLTETLDGNTDIEVMSTKMLMGSTDNNRPKYYSQLTGKTLPGKPRFIKCGSTGTGSYASKDYYMVCTEQGLYRLNNVGLQTMDDWNGMFYNTPAVFNPQAFMFVNNCNFLLNDGKLHVLYVREANDGKFSAPISGDYEADAFLMAQTKTTWRPAPGAIDADQVIYDKKNRRFRPYYSKSASISSFRATNGDAYADANNVSGEAVKIMSANNHQTYAIIKEESGAYNLYDFNFYNRVDNGDLSGNGNRSRLTLSAATDIQQAKYFTACASAQSAFYYATDNTVYSIAPSRGLEVTDSRTVFQAPAGETITCIYAIGSHSSGFPWSTAMLYIATWSEADQQGKVYEYEMDHSEGVPTVMFLGMFGDKAENPSVVSTGWGKIKSMTWMSAE